MITVNNRDQVEWEKDLTVSGLLKKMGYDYALISVHVDDEYIPEETYSTREIADGASVAVIHLAHGG